ncbi:DNA-binding transcriptional regulator, MarR family [bacterium A37T11]|nr:DNA-binding transcriptional regulator, MarR family [bacterium A37T11]
MNATAIAFNKFYTVIYHVIKNQHMKLEDEIKSRFQNEYHKAALNIMFTNSWLISLLKKRTDAKHITLQQYNILRILRGQHPNPATVNLLKERMIDKMPDVSRIIDRLVQKEFVSRCTNNRDRRAVDILITDKGLNILHQLDIDDEMKLDHLLNKNLTEQECQTLNYLLDKMRSG